MESIRESVLPSGVPFSVRNLIGQDQDTLTRSVKKGDSTAFNKMLCDSLRKLGDKDEGQITPADISRMLSNDRAFALLTLRQHTLDYKELFEFKYEWPLQENKQDKEIVDYAIKLDRHNFPVIPYHWVRKAIADDKKTAIENEIEYQEPDGHHILFPVVYSNYESMLGDQKVIKGKFPKSGEQYIWELLDGLKESKYADAVKSDTRVNLSLDMRGPKIAYSVPKELQDAQEPASKGKLPTTFDTSRAHVLDLEHLREEIREKEGSVDTSLAIQHPNDPRRRDRVNLVTLPVFFFPSQAL
jgi:hypothetical protein